MPRSIVLGVRPTTRPRRVASVLLAVVIFVSACTSGGSDSSEPAEGQAATATVIDQPTPERSEPIKLGVAAGRRQGETPVDALVGVENVAGRRFDVLRAYAFWDSEFPDLRHQFASDGDRLVHLSINARRTDGSVVPWQTIADAVDGDVVHEELLAWIDRLASYGAPLRVTFHHEADIEPEFGTPADFVAAWRRFSTLLDDAAPQIETVWVMTGFTLRQPEADDFWPGEDAVDMIGADAFNWFGCRGTPEEWRSPGEVLAPLLDFGANYPDKPLVLAELGTDEDPNDSSRKAAWFNELAELLATPEYTRIDTVIFFHNDHDQPGSTCDWWLDSSDTSAAAARELAAAPLVGGDVAGAAPAQCEIIATAFSSTDDLALVDGDGDGRFDFEFGNENRFLGIGDQSNDGADHRVLLRFDPLDSPLPPGARLELRVRLGERQPSLPGSVQVRLVTLAERFSETFTDPGVVVEEAWFDAGSPGGHHVLDVTGIVDPTAPVALLLQLDPPPAVGDGQSAVYVGMGDASRSIDRPALITRLCG